MQPSEHLDAGTVLAGRYRVVRPLGSGGMGSVYLVEHLHTEQQLALKLLHSTIVQDEVALARFRREARAPAKVGSDHVVQVTDADVAPELGGVPFLVMEWLRGSDLEDLVKERETLTPADTVSYLRQAARALDKAHALGIIHRDLKPENLFLTVREDGTPLIKILDFGIAKLTGGAADPNALKATGTGQIFGTPLYMAPEQIKAELDRIAPHTDIWALGIIAHRLLLGREPWTAETVTHLVAQIAYEPMPVPSEHGSTLGSGFDAWFLKCCAREPGDRFASAGEAVIALAKALEIELAEAPMSLPLPSSSKRAPREAATAFSATAPARSAAGKPEGPLGETSTSGSRAPNRRPLFIAGIAFGLAGIAAGVLIMSRDHAPPSGLATSTTVEAPHADAAKSSTQSAPIASDAPIVTPSIATTITPVASAAVAVSSARADHDAPHAAPGRSTPRAPTAAPIAAAPVTTALPVAPPPTPPQPPPSDDPLGSRH